MLLNDHGNERIILGFENIRRDYGSCDNDFNDAIFYLTANPYTALSTTNSADVDSSSDVTSGNNGGLESNGSLANVIAERNFNRIKINEFNNSKKLQSKFLKNSCLQQKNSDTSLDSYLTETVMYGKETAYIFSQEDLVSIKLVVFINFK